jgi:hypothetical protein
LWHSLKGSDAAKPKAIECLKESFDEREKPMMVDLSNVAKPRYEQSQVKEKANKGQQMHKDYDYGQMWPRKKLLPWKRMDGYDPNNKIVHELKRIVLKL